MAYIEIILATDDNYTKFCVTTMVSILENTTHPVRFHIFDGGIKDFHKNKLKRLENKYNCEIVFYSMKDLILPNVPLNRDWISVATYYRLFITDIISDNISKIIYLDCDVIVDKDIIELWEHDISEYVAGVVEDEHSITNQDRLGLSSKHTYFNAGVLLLNLERLRKVDFKNNCFEYLSKNFKKIEMQDQDILNATFENQCLILPLKFNANTTIFYPYYKSKHKYSDEDVINARENCVIIHYTGTPKPWLRPELEQSDYFWKYARKTDFYEEILIANQVQEVEIREIIKNVYQINRNRLNYLKYKIFNKITIGKKKEHYINKVKIFERKIKDCQKTFR